MIALDTNVLVRYLVRDDPPQAEVARALLETLSSTRPGCVCREVVIELVWVLERAYGFDRGDIATILEQLVTTAGLVIESADAVARSASGYRTGGAGLADRMILDAAERAGADGLYTFDRTAAELDGVTLLSS